MLSFAADENLNFDIVRGVWRRRAAIDIVRIQDVGLSGADDPTVLAWAAEAGRLLLTHDVATITFFAYERIRNGAPGGPLRSFAEADEAFLRGLLGMGAAER